MRWSLVFLLILLGMSPAMAEAPIQGRIIKVLPQLLDKKGRNSLSPSLYDRDAYQAWLRLHPAEISALRFAVQWKAKAPQSEPLRIRVEVHGAIHDLAPGELPKSTSFEQPVRQHHWFSHWVSVNLGADQYRAFGEVTAWRVTLWDGDHLLSEQKSFLW